MEKSKRIDCIAMKRKSALLIHERLKGMTVQEQVEYWQRRERELLTPAELGRVEKEREAALASARR